MNLRPASSALALFPLLLVTACASAAGSPGEQPAPPPSDSGGPAGATPPSAAAPTVAATKGPFTVVLDLKGNFDALGPVEIQYVPLQFNDELEIVEAAPPGPVEKGATLARFKTDKIDEQFKNAEMALAIAKLGLDRQADEFARLEETTALNLARVVKESSDMDVSLKNYQEIEMPLQIAESALSLQWSEDWLQDQTEEYAQLEKMYKADDLTEETEEIVMRRARRGLERSKASLEMQKTWNRLMLSNLPRRLEGMKLEQHRTTLEKDRATAASKSTVDQARLELERARFAFSRQEEQFGHLRKDRESFTLSAPAAGVAVPGALVRGKWTDLDNMTHELHAGRRVRGNQILYTIVRPGEVRVIAMVPEASLFDVREGLEAKVTPAATPAAKMAAHVSRVARVSSGTEYEVVLDLDQGDPRLMPGNTCSVKITAAAKPEAITVPSGSVVEDGDKKFVHVSADGKTEKKEVTVGATSGGRTEILSGLAEGTKVLQNPPK